MINNRQNSRRRGRGGGGGGGQRPGGGGSGPRDSGNRIDSRARGNASQLYEKYKNMASDAQRQGDRINTEYYLQFADHYFRVMSDSRSRQDEQHQRRPQNDFDGYDDEEYGDEGEPIRAGEQDRTRDDQPYRNGGGYQGGGYGRDQRRDEPRDAVRSRDDESRDDSRDEPRGDARDAATDGGPQPANDVDAPGYQRTGRRSRSRTYRAEAAPADGPEPLDAERLPPAIGGGGDEAGDAPKPRRRRTTRAVPGGEASAS